MDFQRAYNQTNVDPAYAKETELGEALVCEWKLNNKWKTLAKLFIGAGNGGRTLAWPISHAEIRIKKWHSLHRLEWCIVPRGKAMETKGRDRFITMITQMEMK